MFGLSPQELLVVFLIILLLFGAKKIPEIARALGKGTSEFKKGLRNIGEEVEKAGEATPPRSGTEGRTAAPDTTQDGDPH